jgi:hypothetical protein
VEVFDRSTIASAGAEALADVDEQILALEAPVAVELNLEAATNSPAADSVAT